MTVGGGAKSGSQDRLPFMQHGDVINMKVGIRGGLTVLQMWLGLRRRARNLNSDRVKLF